MNQEELQQLLLALQGGVPQEDFDLTALFDPNPRVGLTSNGEQGRTALTPAEQITNENLNFNLGTDLGPLSFFESPTLEAPRRDTTVLRDAILRGARAQAAVADSDALEAANLARNTGIQVLLNAAGPNLYRALTGFDVNTGANQVRQLLQQRLGREAELRGQAARERQRLLTEASIEAAQVLQAEQQFNEEQRIATANRQVDLDFRVEQANNRLRQDAISQYSDQLEEAIKAGSEAGIRANGTRLGYSEDEIDVLVESAKTNRALALRQAQLKNQEIQSRIRENDAQGRAAIIRAERSGGSRSAGKLSDLDKLQIAAIDKDIARLDKERGASGTRRERKEELARQIEQLREARNKILGLSFGTSAATTGADSVGAIGTILDGAPVSDRIDPLTGELIRGTGRVPSPSANQGTRQIFSVQPGFGRGVSDVSRLLQNVPQDTTGGTVSAQESRPEDGLVTVPTPELDPEPLENRIDNIIVNTAVNEIEPFVTDMRSLRELAGYLRTRKNPQGRRAFTDEQITRAVLTIMQQRGLN